jgi:hypothetical protein
MPTNPPISNPASVLIQPLQEVMDGCITIHGSHYHFVATATRAGEKFTCSYSGRVNLLDTRTEATIKEGGCAHEFEFDDTLRIEFTAFVQGIEAQISFAGPGLVSASYALRCR